MMRSSLITLARRSAVVRSRVVLPSASRAFFSTNLKKDDHFTEVQGGLTSEQLGVLQEMFGKIEKLESEVTVLRNKVKELDPTFAVDAPDGDSDGHVLEEMLEVEHIIEDAAIHENKKEIDQRHKLEKDVEKFHARDPEHDW